LENSADNHNLLDNQTSINERQINFSPGENHEIPVGQDSTNFNNLVKITVGQFSFILSAKTAKKLVEKINHQKKLAQKEQEETERLKIAQQIRQKEAAIREIEET